MQPLGHPITEPLSSRVRFVVVVRRREREAESVFFARLKKKKPELKLKKKKSSATTQKHTAGLSDASHAVSNGLTSLEDPLGTVAMADHIKVDAAEFRAWNASAKTCSNASLIPKPRLSFAFQGSGLLLPFYQGVVQGLQDRGVLSPAVSKTAAFGGGSGGSLTSVLTALGWPGSKQYETFVGILLAIGACKADLAAQGASDLEQKLQCTLKKKNQKKKKKKKKKTFCPLSLLTAAPFRIKITKKTKKLNFQGPARSTPSAPRSPSPSPWERASGAAWTTSWTTSPSRTW